MSPAHLEGVDHEDARSPDPVRRLPAQRASPRLRSVRERVGPSMYSDFLSWQDRHDEAHAEAERASPSTRWLQGSASAS
jgi:hypothetical protein